MSDEVTCSSWPPACSQLCAATPAGGISCSCVAGYRLNDDERHCTAATGSDATTYVLYSQGSEIHRAALRPVRGKETSKVVFEASDNIRAMGRQTVVGSVLSDFGGGRNLLQTFLCC